MKHDFTSGCTQAMSPTPLSFATLTLPHPLPPSYCRTTTAVWVLPDAEATLNPYNNSLVMPLHEFVEHPIAEELLHNGATLQVGLVALLVTNIEVLHC